MTNSDGFRKDVRGRLAEARADLARFLEFPTDAAFADVIGAFDAIRHPIDAVNGWAGLYAAVHPDEGLRNTANELEQEIASFLTELSLDRGVYDRLAALDADAAPGPDESRVQAHALRDFRRSGVDRDEATRDRIRKLQDELVEIGQAFDRNIIRGARSLRIAEGRAGLAGLPADYIAEHPEADDGSVTVTTDTADYLPFMLYAERADLRKQLSFEYYDRAHPENLPVLGQLLAKRHELAGLLGYDSWAAFVTEDKMIQTPAAARTFIEKIIERARPFAEREYAELLAQKQIQEPGATFVGEWESRYWQESVKRSRFGLDSQSVRPYFAYEKVRDGLLEISSRLYGVQFQRVQEPVVWHPSVEHWEIIDGGETIARFYLDMFPREGKYKHAAMFGLTHGRETSIPEASLVCNFPEPRPGSPGLLLHSEVKTFFHEFGHLLHHLFAGRQRYLEFAGIATEWDFVEVPSQMFEEWIWDTSVLQTFATHHETGEPIPAELVETLRAGEEYGKGLWVTVQMLFASYSLGLYEGDPGVDTTALFAELQDRVNPVRYQPGLHFQAAFGHLHGYSAIYYTYMWSLVIAKDLFGAFEGQLLDEDVAGRYRREVLEPGGSRDATDLVRAFLGRDYGFEPWESWLAR